MARDNRPVSRDDMKDYYGKILQGTKDLKTNVCAVGKTNIPSHIKEAMAKVHEAVTNRYYGCGLVIPEFVDGLDILDLGSGAGMDCFVLSQLVGERGHVTGVDMTVEQLKLSRKYIPYHTEKFAYKEPNVKFIQGYMENLDEVGMKDNTFDIIISNCVVNLCIDKLIVLQEAYRVLKVGGEFYYADIYADRDLPEDIRRNKMLWGEGISGALWWKKYLEMAKNIGFSRPRIVSASKFHMGHGEIEKIVGEAQFVSVTYRLFKLPAARESGCGVIYKGGVTGCENEFKLDYGHVFKTGDIVNVDGEIETILRTSRFCEKFTFQPAERQANGDTPSCSAGKADIVNPFQYVSEIGSDSVNASCGSVPI